MLYPRDGDGMAGRREDDTMAAVMVIDGDGEVESGNEKRKDSSLIFELVVLVHISLSVEGRTGRTIFFPAISFFQLSRQLFCHV